MDNAESISNISIHALRGEGDDRSGVSNDRLNHFNPRPPWGGRQVSRQACAKEKPFQSTPSVGRATVAHRGFKSDADAISIHALRGEGDFYRSGRGKQSTEFQSTPSVGRATIRAGIMQSTNGISIHALRGEGDSVGGYIPHYQRHFNPRPPWGGRRSIFLSPV